MIFCYIQFNFSDRGRGRPRGRGRRRHHPYQANINNLQQAAGAQGPPAANRYMQAQAFQNPAAVAAAIGQIQALIFGINNPAIVAAGNNQIHAPAFEAGNPAIVAPAGLDNQGVVAAGNDLEPAGVIDHVAAALVEPHQRNEIEPQPQPPCQRDQIQEQQRTCVVCLIENATHAYIPCGHYCVCAGCKDQTAETCPLCRAPVAGILSIY